MFKKIVSFTFVNMALSIMAGASVSPPASAELPESLQTHFLEVDGGIIAFDDTGGRGPIILAIPGMGDLRSEYRLLRPKLQEAGYRVVTMDLRGFGETSPRWKDYSAHAVGRDALAVLEHLNAAHAVILGNSFAAGSALWAAHDAPGRVRGVVLLGPIVRNGQQSWLARAALKLGFAGPWCVWLWTAYWNSLFPTHKPLDQAQVRAALTRNLHEPGRMTALWTMVNLSKDVTESLLSLSQVPALVIMGTRDPDFPDAVAEARWLASQLKANCLVVDGAGHYPQTEMPELVAPDVISFIKSLPDDFR